MSLILKTDTVYVGTVEAKHILNFLTDTGSKTKYLKRLLQSIDADSEYITDNNSNDLTSRLLNHVSNVQKKGASVLSLPYTLKAIAFIKKHNLNPANFIAVSPDFGADYDHADGSVDAMYGIDGSVITNHPSVNAKLKIDNFLGQNVVRGWDKDAIVTSMRSDKVLIPSDGLIMGQCALQSDYATGSILKLRDTSWDGNRIGSTNIRITRGSNGVASVLFQVAKTSFIDITNVQWNAPSPESLQKSGISTIINYNTTNNKIFNNGDEVASSSTDPSFNMSGMELKMEIEPRIKQMMGVELWLINSKSTPLAAALSNHLNRQ